MGWLGKVIGGTIGFAMGGPYVQSSDESTLKHFIILKSTNHKKDEY